MEKLNLIYLGQIKWIKRGFFCLVKRHHLNVHCPRGLRKEKKYSFFPVKFMTVHIQMIILNITKINRVNKHEGEHTCDCILTYFPLEIVL